MPKVGVEGRVPWQGALLEGAPFSGTQTQKVDLNGATKEGVGEGKVTGI